MTLQSAVESAPARPLRLWPGVVAVSVQWLVRFILPAIVPATMEYAVLGGAIGGVAVALWWLFFSRAPWVDRIGTFVLAVTAVWATYPFVDKSIATGAQGMLLPILAIPGICLALVAAAAVSRRLPLGLRRATVASAIVLACGVWTLVRTGGFNGSFENDLRWRWAPTPEEQFLAQAAKETPKLTPAVAAAIEAPLAVEPKIDVEVQRKELAPIPSVVPQVARWGGFRGNGRDGRVTGIRINTDWSASPPVQLWRRPVGPGWSSFAVSGDFFFTQEQRGSEEVVSCYSLATGELIWKHSDAARFWESNAGAGPRGTPTLADGHVYTFGATGILNALKASTGAVVWSRNAATDTKTEIPGWGFSSSPIVSDGVVIIAVAGQLVGYDQATGAPKWLGPQGGGGYSSPHMMKVGGVPQVVHISNAGVNSVDLTAGKLLWDHAWKGSPIVQPALTADGDLLVTTTEGAGGAGIRRLAITHAADGWKVEERWTSAGLKPYFSDFVVHKGHAYGFDGSILSCIDLSDGKRKWKGGRYGHGQLVLLADQDVLLVLSEEGELALVSAEPSKFTELSRRPAIEGKTWNHPVVIGDVVLARNSDEMVAFRLPPADR